MSPFVIILAVVAFVAVGFIQAAIVVLSVLAGLGLIKLIEKYEIKRLLLKKRNNDE